MTARCLAGHCSHARLLDEALRRRSGDRWQAMKLDGKSVTVIGVVQPAPFFPGRVSALLNMVNSEHHVSATMVQGRTHA